MSTVVMHNVVSVDGYIADEPSSGGRSRIPTKDRTPAL